MIIDISDVASLLGRVVDVGCECLASTPLGVPNDCRVYHSDPPADCCDALVVWLERIYPSRSFPVPYTGAIDSCGTAGPVAAIALKLLRPCWPTVTDQAPYVPATADMELAATNLAIDGTALWCCLYNDLSGSPSTILGDPNTGVQCTAISMGALTPERNTGGCAGWAIRFSVALEGCC